MKSNNTKLLEKLNTNFSHTPNNDQNKANESVDAALTAIEARHKLWSAILGEIEDVSS